MKKHHYIVSIFILLCCVTLIFVYHFHANRTLKQQPLSPETIVLEGNDSELKTSIEEYLRRTDISQDEFALCISDSEEITIQYNGSKEYRIFSLYRLPLSMYAYEQIAAGEIKAETTLVLDENDYTEDSTICDRYQLQDHISIEVLLEAMIQDSDDTAGRMLYDHLGGWTVYQEAVKRYSPESGVPTNIEEFAITPLFMNDILEYLYQNKETFSDLIEDMKSCNSDLFLNENIPINMPQIYGCEDSLICVSGFYADGNKPYRITVFTSLKEDAQQIAADLNEMCFEYYVKEGPSAEENMDDQNGQTPELPDQTESQTVKEPELRKVQIPVEQSVQENGYYCVPACVEMVLRLHAFDISQSQLASEMNTSSITGTEYADLARVVNRYAFGKDYPGPNDPGYRVQTLERNVNDPQAYALLEQRIKTDIRTNDPVFVAIDVKAIYPHLYNGNHMVIITGYAYYEGSDEIAYYYLIDPSYVVQDPVYGGLKTVTKEELFEAIITNVEPAYIW